MIEQIHCYGTSNTHGGGFEFWRDDEYSDLLKKFYKETPLNQFNYSWPGQLQKILPNIRVFNHAKSGYGNELMYRKAYNEIITGNIEKKLFIFEFSYLGRKEFYSNTIKDYFIVNYKFNDDKSFTYNGLATTYHDLKQENIDRKVLDPITIPFIFETINAKEQYELMKRNQEFFIDFLLMKKVNFLFFGLVEYSNLNLINDKAIKFDCKRGEVTDIPMMLDEFESIAAETNYKIDDYHPGLIGHKKIAKIVLEKINKNYKLNDKRLKLFI